MEDAETCPYYKYQTKVYGEDFYQENTLIFLRCAAAGSPVKYSLLNVVKNEDGSYCIQVECARYAAVQDLPCSTLIVIVVNEAIPENARLDVDIATRIVCWPEVLDESEFDW